MTDDELDERIIEYRHSKEFIFPGSPPFTKDVFIRSEYIPFLGKTILAIQRRNEYEIEYVDVPGYPLEIIPLDDDIIIKATLIEEEDRDSLVALLRKEGFEGAINLYPFL